MAKKLLTPRKTVRDVKSVKEFPFTGSEIREMEEIQENPYWARKQLKLDFCTRNSRIIEEVDEYFKKHRRAPLTTEERSLKESNFTIDRSGSTPAPKEQVTTPPADSTANVSGTIRVSFKKMTVEGNIITFEI